jgi:hypothetical protein
MNCKDAGSFPINIGVDARNINSLSNTKKMGIYSNIDSAFAGLPRIKNFRPQTKAADVACYVLMVLQPCFINISVNFVCNVFISPPKFHSALPSSAFMPSVSNYRFTYLRIYDVPAGVSG